MLKNYLLIAFRNLQRNKIFSLINILGLALGLACSLFIFLWVLDERGVDQFNENSDRLYSVYERQYTGGRIRAQYYTPGIMADEMKKVLPELQYATGFYDIETHTFMASGKSIKAAGSYAGSDYFKIFHYTLLKGAAATALSAPADIVLSKAMAIRLFNSPENAIGQTLRFEGQEDFRVTAVFEAPQNASSQFDYLINWHAFLEHHSNMKRWANNGVSTFILLKEGIDAAALEKKITHFLGKYDEYSGDFRAELGLQRFDEMYLYNHFNSLGFPDGGRIEYVRIFSIVAVFILLIACINFMNLTTARAARRAREIGVRKVIGAFRSSLVRQFIGEAITLAALAMVVALLLVVILLPVFNALTQKNIVLPTGQVYFWPAVVVITLITGVIAGSYPAFFLSSFKPVNVLKGKLQLGKQNILFRKGLVVFQFVLSIGLIIATLVVSSQVDYIQSRNLGFDRSSLLYIPQEGAFQKQYQVFKTAALALPGIEAVSRTEEPPTNMQNSTWGVNWEGKDPSYKPTFSYAGVGYDFTKTMNTPVLLGRDFSKEFATDSAGYILNESAVKQTGLTDPIGKSFTLWGRKAPIIGVIKDFHFNSLHVPINPMVLWYGENAWGGYILVKTKPGQIKEALAGLEKLWKQLNPAFPYTWQFADDAYRRLYNGEQLIGKLSRFFALLAIVISCLGLLGLAIFTAEQRAKEISIRKVLGASIAAVFGLLSKEFLWLVLIALLIVSPLAWLLMHIWLQSYAYHTGISWWMFGVAGLAAILITLLTIGLQALRAAVANPIKSLRTE